MGKSIILNDFAAKSVIDLAKRRIEEIDRELLRLNELKEEKRSLVSTIDQLSTDEEKSTYDANYQNTWTWFKKAKYILEKVEGKEMTTREIVDELLLREPALDRRRVVSAISSILSTTKDEQVIGGKNDRGEKTYSIPNGSQEYYDDKVDLPF